MRKIFEEERIRKIPLRNRLSSLENVSFLHYVISAAKTEQRQIKTAQEPPECGMSNKKDTLNSHDLDATLVLTGRHNTDHDVMSKLEQEQINAPEFASRFQFICNYAAGGVGVVSKAKDVVFDRVVAVKALNDTLKDDPRAIGSFLYESRLNANLDHPSIVPVYALGKGRDGRWECVTKFIHGSSLNAFIDRIREKYDSRKINNLQEHRALVSRLEYFLKICEAVEYCHSMKIVHGDLKPDNILMGKFGELYLMDWGCAKETGSKPDQISGTPNYLPPEYLREKTVTPQIDIFALGMILFEMTTLRRGKQECSGKQSDDCTCRVVFDPKNYVHYQTKLKISPRIKAVIYKAVNPDPAERYQTVGELSADVRHFIYDEEVSAAPDNLIQKLFRKIYRNRMKTVLITGGIFLLLSAGLFFSYYRANRAEQRHSADTMRRLTLQTYTDYLATNLEKRFLTTQAQLLLFADNLLEDTLENNPRTSRFYDSALYRNPRTSPPGMIRSAYYPNPINLSHMVRTLPDQQKEPGMKLRDPKEYVYICNKILLYDLFSHNTNDTRDIHNELLSKENRIQRLYIKWADGTRYSYPGTYDDPATSAYRNRWDQEINFGVNRKIFWSAPYRGVTGTHRIACRYPLFTPQNKFLGLAGIETRLEKMLEPLILANQADPVHELYLLTGHGTALYIAHGKVELIDKQNTPANALSLPELDQLHAKLKANNMRQIEDIIRNEPYYISGIHIPALDAVLLQMISAAAMENHNHELKF